MLLQQARFVDENGNVCVSKEIKTAKKLQSTMPVINNGFELTDELIIEHESIQANMVHLDQRNVHNEALAIMKRSVELAVGDEGKIKYLLQKMNEILLKLERERHVTIEGGRMMVQE